MTLRQAAPALGVSRGTAYLWALRGWLRAELIAGRWLVSREALEECRRTHTSNRVKRPAEAA
jgi:excisionase family DNA binding protein